MKKKYYVYVIELDSTVADIKKFRKENPKYFMNNHCVYVGQSSRKPDVRFEQHKEGYKSNRYAKKFGLKLRPDLYEKYNPIPTRKDAEAIEKMVAEQLRNQGFGVWFN
ncbi:MAG: GIY-YIG nuclease family protein [Candidatus Marinimicrobia bacterium]|nr:GIY-YIG nuclease family protein [Candidatus Neomarinimicrobiota bacterium]